jgi:hypothetical protein
MKDLGSQAFDTYVKAKEVFSMQNSVLQYSLKVQTKYLTISLKVPSGQIGSTVNESGIIEKPLTRTSTAISF